MRYFVDTGPSKRGGMPRGVVDLRPASIKELHRAPVMARCVASLSCIEDGGLPQYRVLDIGAAPFRLWSASSIRSVDHMGASEFRVYSSLPTARPYGSLLGVNGACQMKVNQMSLALALWPKGMQPWGVDLESIIAGYFRLEKTFSRHARADIRPICYSRLEPCMCDVNLRGFRPLLTFSVATPRPLTTCIPCPAELELTVAN